MTRFDFAVLFPILLQAGSSISFGKRGEYFCSLRFLRFTMTGLHFIAKRKGLMRFGKQATFALGHLE